MHEPWRLSAYQVQSALLGVPPAARVSARLAAPEVVIPALADGIRDELREFTRLGGFTLRPGSTPWFGAALRTRAQARDAVELAVALSARTLPQAGAMLAAACRETGLPPASSFSYPERVRLTHLFQLLHEAGQPSRGFRERRALRRQAKGEWAALAGPGSPAAPASPGSPGEPRLPSGYPALAQAWQECSRQVSALAALAPLAGLEDDPEAAAAALAADRETPWRLPRLHELARRFEALGLAPLLDEIGSVSDTVTPDLLVGAFDYAWYQSILDQIRVRDPDYGAEYGVALDEIAEEFRCRDTEHLAANRARVRNVWAGQLRETVDKHPLQARVIRKQAALRRGHLPLRRLLDQTGDVLFALKPCWAMSPLMVSQVLPLARMFDLVIFDEASQIVPADAIGSMIRAHQVVVAGDDRQLPPTNFFRQADSGDPDDDDLADETVFVRRGVRVGARRAAAAAADLPAELALPQQGRAPGGVLQRPDLRRRADHVPRRRPRRLPAARGDRGRRRRGRRGGPADPGARPGPAVAVPGRDSPAPPPPAAPASPADSPGSPADSPGPHADSPRSPAAISASPAGSRPQLPPATPLPSPVLIVATQRKPLPSPEPPA